MARAESLENNLYPFGELGDTSAQELLSYGFPHDHFETCRSEGKTSKGGLIQYTTYFNFLKKTPKNKWTLDDELKLTFPVDGTSSIARLLVNRAGDVETHVDFGEKKIGSKPFNLFANFTSKLDFSTIGIRLGANYFSSNVNSSTHFQTDLEKLTVWQRLSGKKDKISWGLATAIGCNLNLSQYDAVVGYETNDIEVYAKHTTSPEVSGIKPQVLSLEALYKKKDTNVAIVASKDLGSTDAIKSLEIGGSTKIGGRDVKAKIDKDLNISAAVNYKHNDTYNFTFGVSIPAGNFGKAETKNGFLPVDLGYSCDFNL